MINNIVFDAAQAEVAYRREQLYETHRNLRLRKQNKARWFSRKSGYETAQQPVQEQVRAPAREEPTTAPPTRHDPTMKEGEKVSAR